MKKTCIIYANCQGRLLENYLSKSFTFNQQYSIKRFPVHILMAQGTTAPSQVLKQADLFIYQEVKEIHGIHSSKHLLQKLPANCQRISFPSMYFTGYFPQYCKNPVNKAYPNYPAGIIPHGDSNIISMLNQGKSRSEIIKSISDPDFYTQEFLLNNLQNTLAELIQREHNLSIKISEFIKDNYQHYYLFHTHNHPSNILGIYVVNQILKLLGISHLGDPLSFEQLTSEALGQIQIPIYPSVIKHLSLTFIDQLKFYTNHCFCTARMTFNRHIAEYISFHLLTPESASYFFSNGVDLLSQGKLTKAKAALIKAIKKDPNNAACFRELADIFLKENNLDAAELTYRKAIEISPYWIKFYISLGDILNNKKDWQSALLVYQKALSVAPHNAKLQSLLGNILIKLNKLDLAEVYYQKAIKNDPFTAKYYRYLGDIYFKNKDLELAELNYQQAIKLAPKSAYLYIRMGSTLAKQTRLEEAIVTCRQAISLNPKNPNFYCTLGNIHLQKREVDAALDSYYQAIKLNPNQTKQIFVQLSNYISKSISKSHETSVRSGSLGKPETVKF